MAITPGTHTFTGGSAPSSEMNSYVRDPINFLLHPPICHVLQIVAQTFTSGVGAAVTFTSEIIDTDVGGLGGHSNSSNTSRFTAQYPGWYALSGGVSFAANATSVRNCWWRVNGVDLDGSEVKTQAMSAGVDSVLAARTVIAFLDIGVYAELFAIQVSGGNLDTVVTGTEKSSMTIRFAGAL